jgi:hypothetical protein
MPHLRVPQIPNFGGCLDTSNVPDLLWGIGGIGLLPKKKQATAPPHLPYHPPPPGGTAVCVQTKGCAMAFKIILFNYFHDIPSMEDSSRGGKSQIIWILVEISTPIIRWLYNTAR